MGQAISSVSVRQPSAIYTLSAYKEQLLVLKNILPAFTLLLLDVVYYSWTMKSA